MEKRYRKKLPLIGKGDHITVERGFNDVRKVVNRNVIRGPTATRKAILQGAAGETVRMTLISAFTAEAEIDITDPDDPETVVGKIIVQRTLNLTLWDPDRGVYVDLPTSFDAI